jgi:hypothetical protein
VGSSKEIQQKTKCANVPPPIRKVPKKLLTPNKIMLKHFNPIKGLGGGKVMLIKGVPRLSDF